MARCVAFAAACSLAACLPNIPGLVSPSPLPTSTVELTTAAQPTATPVSVSSPFPSPTSTAQAAATFTPIPTLTAATEQSTAATPTALSSTPVPTQPAATATSPESISLDKLPRGTVYKSVHVENVSHSQMDISLHCTTVHGLHTVLEYNNVKNLTVQAPEGDYIYVVYVGGRQITGSFSLLHVPSATITVYKDRVAIH